MVQVHRLSPNGRVTYTAVSTVLKIVGAVKAWGSAPHSVAKEMEMNL